MENTTEKPKYKTVKILEDDHVWLMTSKAKTGTPAYKIISNLIYLAEMTLEDAVTKSRADAPRAGGGEGTA